MYNEEFTRKVIPFIKPEYFSDPAEKLVFKEVFDFVILHPGEHEMAVLEQDQNFVTIMGDILTELLLKKFEDETGTNNPKEFGV